MTHTPEAIRAAELANAMVLERYEKSKPIYRAETFEGQMAESSHIACTRYIRTVSDAVEAVTDPKRAHSMLGVADIGSLRQFILPKPVDPLVSAMMSLVPLIPQPSPGETYADAMARETYAALDAAGFEIVRKGGLPTPGEK